MNGHRFHQAVFAGCLGLALLIPRSTVEAQDLNFVEIPLENFHDQKPVELLGLISSQSLNIPVPQSWLPGEENWLDIKVRASPLLDFARSSLTIALNGLQIGSYNLAEIPATEQRIQIPANMFTQGNNTLTFTGTLYLPDDSKTNCQNWDSPARWLVVEPGGLLHLSFVRRQLPVDLAYFPQILIEPLEKFAPEAARRRTVIVLPENSAPDDLTSLSTISYILGSNAETNYDWKPVIVSESKLTSSIATNRNILFIGHAPSEFQGMADENKNYVALFPSPWGVGNAVMIIGDQNGQDGFSPASVFSDPARSILLHGNVAYIDEQNPKGPQPFLNTYSFEDLGYLDRTVRGIGQHNLIYSLFIPYNVDPVLVKLNLALAHAPDLDIQNSSFTVYLNGISVAGILPTARSSTGMPITVGLPARQFRPGVNFIRIGFDLHVPYSSCERAPESVWATILNNTALEVTYRDHLPIPSLKHFPLPFSDHTGSVFVIPDQYNQNDLVRVSQLSFMLGASSYRFNDPPKMMTAINFMSRKTEYNNAILVGLPSQNSATMSANDLLPQPFTKDGNSIQTGYGIYLPTSEKDASLGLLQIIPSPWVKGGTVLVLTGNDQQGLDWVWRVILNPALRDQFAGNLMAVGAANRSASSGEVSSQENPRFIFQQIADASNIPIIGPLLQRGGQAFLAPSLIAVGTALLLVICILWFIRIVRARNTQRAIEK